MDKNLVFKEFLEKNEILIVDKNPGSRNRLLKTMSDLGAKRHTIHTSGSLAEAEQIIATKRIGIVLSDYVITGGSGFDLFKLLREKNPDRKDLCLILVTSNISQSAVAKAAEEDVDSFIIKPYTIQSIQESLISTIVAKVKPTEYILKIEEGKAFMLGGKLEESIPVFRQAAKLHPKPALAMFYIGQVEYLLKKVDAAEASYSDGLTFLSIHYKCLVGLYEMFMRERKYFEAYQVVKKIAKFFPANPDRLAQIIRLAIQTQNYQDMEMYYDIFKSLDERAQVLINHLGAGMYIAGKHSLLKKDINQALKYFDHVAVSCSEFSKFLKAIVSLLVEHKMASSAERFLSRFTASARLEADYLISEYLVYYAKGTEKNTLVKHGLDLYNRKVKDHQCMTIMIEAMTACGYKEEKIRDFREELTQLFPERSQLSA
ncbi:MAG TPA: response regulator [Bacteriovoracaceae bacterium]|nr:response regulator [Bacteriovoracaceae bacterium]